MLWMNTFHSVFAKILRREALYLGYEPNFTIYDQSDSKSLVRSIIKEMQLDEKLYKPSTVAERISSAKSNMIYPEDYARDGERMNSDQRSRIPSVYKIYTRYCERCRQANAMDFDDLLINTYRLFDEHPEVLERYSERFKYVLVDEFQDTNYVQGCIVWQLTQARNIRLDGEVRDQHIACGGRHECRANGRDVGQHHSHAQQAGSVAAKPGDRGGNEADDNQGHAEGDELPHDVLQGDNHLHGAFREELAEQNADKNAEQKPEGQIVQ